MVKQGLIGLIVAAISLLVPTLAMAQENAFTVTSGEAEISGTVYEADGVTPVADAQVTLIDLRNEVIGLRLTGEDGSYNFGSVEMGSYQLMADRSGSADATSTTGSALDAAEFVAISGGTAHTVNLTFTLPGAISGYVYAADGITPLDSAAVSVYDYMTHQSIGTAFTTPDGWYSIDALPSGEYLVQAANMGSVPSYAENQLTLESAPPVNVSGGVTTEGVNFALQPAAYFSGMITEVDGITPIANAAVYAYDYDSDETVAWVEADETGAFSLSVPEGTYRLTAYQFDYETRDYTSIADSAEAEALTVVSGDSLSGLDFRLATFGIVSGSVYQADGVTPAGGVSVLIYDSPTATIHTYSTITLANGAYTRAVIEGTYYFSAVSPTDGTVYYDDKLSLGAANPVTVPPSVQVSNIDMQFNDADVAATITATVDLQGRPAKPNARWSVPLQVTLTRVGETAPAYNQTLTTDQNGVFTIPGIPPGAYRLLVKHSHTLATAVAVTLVTGNNAVNVGILREGDANNDNIVSLPDFSILASAFGRQLLDAGYDARADFNLDNTITITDFSLLASVFGQQGAVP